VQAGVYLGKGDVQVKEWPVPELQAGEILVRVKYAGMCGTDMLIYSGKHPRVALPRVLGQKVLARLSDQTIFFPVSGLRRRAWRFTPSSLGDAAGTAAMGTLMSVRRWPCSELTAMAHLPSMSR
jgi:hypothetical protein